MVGSAQLTCLTNGHWDKSPPACGMSKNFIIKDRKHSEYLHILIDI